MAGGCSNRASIVVSIAWQHRNVLPTGMMLAPVCSDRLLPGRAMHCICRAIHWDSSGICCLGYSDRVVNGILALRESLTPRAVLAISGDARCRACVMAVRGRGLAPPRISFTVGCERSENSITSSWWGYQLVLTARQRCVRTLVWLVGNYQV